jgi:hypothetical protein
MQAETICKNCGNRFTGKFCNQCGEKVYTEHDKTFGHFLEEGFHFITHFDSKLLKTWWLIMTRPGFVSKEIADGRRKPYYKPLNLFIIGVILYLLFPFLPGLNMPLSQHVKQLHGPIGTVMVRNKMESKHITFKQLSDKFDKKSPKFAKVLLLIVIPLSGLVLQLLFANKKRYFFDHITLASELNTFYLYLIFFIVPLVYTIVLLVTKLFGGSYFDLEDFITIPLYFLVVGAYCTRAFQRFYGQKKAWAIFKSVLFLVAHGVIVYIIYRFILFCLVLLFI